MAFYRSSNGGGGIQPPDYFNTWYKTGNAQTYTFSTKLQYVYVCCLRNSSSAQAVITTSGTYSVVHTDTYQIMYLLKNIAPNDTIKVPTFSVGGNYRSILFFIGKKA